MKKSKGFTLTEVLTVMVLLAVLIGLGTPIYLRISSNVRNNEYNSKINYIKSQAMKYAEEQNIENSQTITVSTLISNGYIVADKYNGETPFITNPKNESDNLACNLISIDVDGYEYNVDVKDEKNCELLNQDVSLTDLNVKAYKYTSSIGSEIGKSVTSFDWVNTDVLVAFAPTYADIESMTVTHNGNTRTVELDKRCNLGNLSTTCSNVELVKASTVIKDQIIITVNIREDGKVSKIKTATVEVKIDKETPSVSSAVYDGWTSKNKSVTAFINDGSGSGAESVFLTNAKYLDPATETRNFKANNNSNGAVKIDSALTSGIYYLWARDKAGNISPEPTEVLVSDVDNNKPQCTSSGDNTTWTRNAITIKWGCKDNESGCDPNFSGGTKTFSGGITQKQYTIPAYTIKDNAGNVTECPAKTINIYHDTQAPNCPVYNEKTTWTRDPVTINYGCSDSGSGCATPTKSITYQQQISYQESYAEKEECDKSGCWQYYEKETVPVYTQQVIKNSILTAYDVVDNVGNARTCYPSGKTLNIYYDHQAPNVKVKESPKKWNRSPYNTLDNITYSDPDSGIASAYCTPGNASEYGSQGKKKVDCIVRDNVGNEANVSYYMYHEYEARYNPKVCTRYKPCNCYTEYDICGCEYEDVLEPHSCGGENCFTSGTQFRSRCTCDTYSEFKCHDTCPEQYDCSYYDCPDGGVLGDDHICRY